MRLDDEGAGLLVISGRRTEEGRAWEWMRSGGEVDLAEVDNGGKNRHAIMVMHQESPSTGLVSSAWPAGRTAGLFLVRPAPLFPLLVRR